MSELDHPLMFVLFTLMVVTVGMYLLGWSFNSLGWTGPATLVRGYGAAPTSVPQGAETI